MRARTRTYIVTFAAALALASIGSLAGSPARADAASWLTTRDVFHFPAWAPNGSRCISRWIRLREGYYSNGAFLVSMRHRNSPDMYKGRDIGVTPSARYAWKACRWWSSKYRQYFVSSKLSRGSWQHRRVNELNSNHAFGDGLYEWGGRLQFTGPLGVTHPQR